MQNGCDESEGFRGYTALRLPLIILCLTLLYGGNAAAQSNVHPRLKGAVLQAVEIHADKLQYDRVVQSVEAVGNVIITKGGSELRADYVHVDMNTEEALATGHVTLKSAGKVWTGPRLEYNFKTQTGRGVGLAFDVPPYQMLADETERQHTNMYLLRNAIMSTCSNRLPDTHYSVKAKEAEVVPGDYLVAHDATFYFEQVPVFYLPYWYRPLQGEYGLTFLPGYDSEMGAFLLGADTYPLEPGLDGITHLDYRTLRGVGVGQDFKWHDRAGTWGGDFAAYYTDDQRPLQDPSDTTADVNNERYRLRLRDHATLGPQDSALVQLNYLSDTNVLKDFFEREYKLSTQPENYGTYTHRGENYTVNVLAQGRLNDFYSTVDRIPEVDFNMMRQRIGESPLYYQGQNSAAFLDYVNAKGSSNGVDYSAFRVDSSHMLYYPEKLEGFLVVIPRAGYRATYYSATPEYTTEVVASTNQSASETNTVLSANAGPSTLRSSVELGTEASFKAFKVWYGTEQSYRHVVEPYADYTFIPEPTVSPAKLYQFDSVDAVTNENDVKVGVRNLLEEKRGDAAYTPVDIDVYTILNVSPEAGQESFQDIYFKMVFRPAAPFKLDLDGDFNLQDSRMAEFDTRLSFQQSRAIKLDFEYLYTESDSSLLTATVALFPERAWEIGLYTRCDTETGGLEEQDLTVQRNLDCLVIRTGIRWLPAYTASDGSKTTEEWRAVLEIWLTAFPHSGMRMQ